MFKFFHDVSVASDEKRGMVTSDVRAEDRALPEDIESSISGCCREAEDVGTTTSHMTQ